MDLNDKKEGAERRRRDILDPGAGVTCHGGSRGQAHKRLAKGKNFIPEGLNKAFKCTIERLKL